MADPLKERISLLQEAEAQAIARGKTLKPEAQAELDRYRTQGLVKGPKGPSATNPAAISSMKNDEIIAAIENARSLAKGGWATGMTGQILGRFGGTDAADLQAPLETIEGNLTIDNLMNLKSASSTGASGFGSLTEREGRLLAASVASLKQNQSQEQFLKNLDMIERHYRTFNALNAGEDPNLPEVQKKYNILPLGGSYGATPPTGTPPNSPAGGPPDETGKYAGADIQMHMDSPENAQGYRFTPTQETALREYLTGGKATPEGYGRMMTAFAAAQGVNVDDAYTQSATAQGQKLIEAAKAGKLGDGMSYNQSDKDYRDRLLAEHDAKGEPEYKDYSSLMASGQLAGGSDELKGIIGGVGSALSGNGFEAGYTKSRDTVRAIRDRAYEKHPYISGATEMLGALGTPGGVAKDVMRGGTLAERIAAGGKAGFRQGIAAGYGYGEGAGDSIKGAGIGALSGAAIGAALPIAGKSISAAYNFATKRPALAGGQQLADAAAKEGVPISRPFIDPSVRNKMTYLETTRGGNAPVRQGMQNTADAIETRAGNLGAGGNPLDPYAGGRAIQDAGKGYITRAKSLTDRLYDRAKNAVPKGMEIEPVQALATLDDHIAELNKSPAQNASEIRYLKAIRSDLTKQPVDTGLLDASGKPIFRPGEGLSIDTIRHMRTNMRGQISERNLTLSKAESRVMDVLGSASRDIQTQLAEKAPMAGARYARADAAFRGKQEKIKRAIQPFLGPRLDNIQPEAAFSRFESMAKNRGNRDALQSIWKEIPPSEQRDLAATFAEPLGKDNAGDFSPAKFIADAARLSPVARQTIFGPEGAESVNNLVRLSNQWRKVSRNLNNSRSGVAFNYRDTLGSAIGFIGGGTLGALEGGATTGGVAALTTAAAVNGLRQGRNFLSAHALMSPNVSKWLKSTPTNPAAIEGHIARLSTIAAREPAISGDIISLQNYLSQAFNQAPLRAAAGPENQKHDRRPPPENNGQ